MDIFFFNTIVHIYIYTYIHAYVLVRHIMYGYELYAIHTNAYI